MNIRVIYADMFKLNVSRVIASGMKQSSLRSLYSLHSFAMTVVNLMINKNLDKEYPEAAGLVKKIKEITKVDYASDSEVSSAVDYVLSTNSTVVDSYKNGKGQVIGFLIGQVQKELNGKGNPKFVSEILTKKLNV